MSLLWGPALPLSSHDHQNSKTLQFSPHSDGGQEQDVAPKHNLTAPAGAGMAVHMQVCFVLWHDTSTACSPQREDVLLPDIPGGMAY